jgi:hypothetical protein
MIGDTLISKEAIFGFAIWLITAIGVGANNGITQQENEVASESLELVVAQQVTEEVEAFSLPVENRVSQLLLMQYRFGERSKKVERLQSFLGVSVDGVYGRQTRNAHISALQEVGEETAFVPAVTTNGKSGYNIPSDPEQRCPKFEPLFKQYGLQPVEVFSYIAYRESRCRPNAVNAKWDSKGRVVWTLNSNGSIDRGLLQINSCWKSVTKQVCGTELDGLFNIDCNLRVAKYLMDNSSNGLGNWNVWKN